MTEHENGPQPNDYDKHEQRIRDLSKMNHHTPSTFEGVLDNADVAYVTAHAAGMLRDEQGNEEPFEFPSVRRERLYREEVERDRPPVIDQSYLGGHQLRDDVAVKKHREFEDPEKTLVTYRGPYAIREIISDNDFLDGSSEVIWLAARSKDEAEGYVRRVGDYHEKPGPGEDDGVYTSRSVIKNPHYNGAEPSETAHDAGFFLPLDYSAGQRILHEKGVEEASTSNLPDPLSELTENEKEAVRSARRVEDAEYTHYYAKDGRVFFQDHETNLIRPEKKSE